MPEPYEPTPCGRNCWSPQDVPLLPLTGDTTVAFYAITRSLHLEGCPCSALESVVELVKWSKTRRTSQVVLVMPLLKRKKKKTHLDRKSIETKLVSGTRLFVPP